MFGGIKWGLVALAAVSLQVVEVQACVSSFPIEFLYKREPMLETMMDLEVDRLAQLYFAKELARELPRSTEKTVKGDYLDFIELLRTQVTDEKQQAQILADYIDFAQACRKGDRTATFKHELAGVEEFVLYLQGSAQYYADQENKVTPHPIPTAWQALLELPPEKRHYRTSWALHMIGAMTKDPAAAYQLNEQLRDAVGAGFADRLGLAHWSMDRDARSLDSPVQTLKHRLLYYAYTRKIGRDPMNRAEFGLRRMLDQGRKKPEWIKAWQEDPICREIMISYVTSYDFPIHPRRMKPVSFDLLNWLPKHQSVAAGRLAWVAQQLGELELAKAFLKGVVEDDLLAWWVRAELARAEGDLKAEAKSLKAWVTCYQEKEKKGLVLEPLLIWSDWHMGLDNHDLAKEVRGHLGVVYVKEENFVSALHTFIEAGSWPDAANIAEQILSVEGLMAYVKAHCPPLSEEESERINGMHDWGHRNDQGAIQKDLRRLLFRRLVRMERFDDALTFFEESETKSLRMYVDCLNIARDKSRPNEERALAYLNAGRIIGPHLIATEMAPDSRITGYSFPEPGFGVWAKSYDNPKIHEMTIPNRPQWNYRRHWCYVKAELMEKAAELTQNRALKATASLWGGRYIMHKQPKLADPHYKRLVNARAGLLSDWADQKRWFPDDKYGLGRLFNRTAGYGAMNLLTLEEIEAMVKAVKRPEVSSVVD